MVDGFVNSDFTVDNDATATTWLSAKACNGANLIFVVGGFVSNLGITYASNTLSVASSDGTALSAVNPSYVVMQSSSNPGETVTYTVTANQGFIDDTGASEIINNLFGLPTGVAYTEDIPFYIYAVGNDAEDTIAFMISRVPGLSISPAVANIGAPDDAVADTQGSFFSFDNIDETLYDTNPCICIGSFRMRMSAADDWTVQALDIQDGIGRYQEGRAFTFPTGAFGAAAGTHWIDNGGTAPVFGTQTYNYYMYLDGSVSLYYTGETVNNVPAGAVESRLSSPFYFDSNSIYFSAQLDVGAANENGNAEWTSSNYASFVARSLNLVQNTDFAAGDNAYTRAFGKITNV